MNISATIIKDSISPAGVRITTFELEYPRFIHAEFMTHRMLSKNCASSRAIPISKVNEMVKTSPAHPVYWGANQAGMQSSKEVDDKDRAAHLWNSAAAQAAYMSDAMANAGLHKQIANRVTEPFQTMKTVATGTEWANLLWLRNHEAAQPEFHELATEIQTAFENSTPEMVAVGSWHLPYVDNPSEIGIDSALKLSASCCAQVSYRKLDESLEKALDIYDKLVGMDRKHASPFEHQATPIASSIDVSKPLNWPNGVTHMTANGGLWSGNLRGWIQHRQLIQNHVVW